MQKEQNLLWNTLKTAIETIPGIVGFDSINCNESSSIIINEIDNNKLEIRIAILINRNINSKNISKQIYEMASFVLKKENKILRKLNVYVKGAK